MPGGAWMAAKSVHQPTSTTVQEKRTSRGFPAWFVFFRHLSALVHPPWSVVHCTARHRTASMKGLGEPGPP